MDLTIILVNYKTGDLTIQCLESVFKQPASIQYEVIVVDNCSSDGSIEKIQRAFPQIKTVVMSYNAGFARANNVGLAASTATASLMLNTDTIIEHNSIQIAYEKLISSPYVACGVQLLNADRTPQISGNYFMKGGLNNLLPLPYVGVVLKTVANVMKVKKPNVPNATGTVEVDWINGAFLMVKNDVVEMAGLLDEDFFLYAEETEWCSRLRKYGPLCIFGEVKVVHLQGETANATFRSSSKGYQNLYDRKGLQIVLSNFLRIRKQYGTGWLSFHLLVYTFTTPFYLLGLIFENLFRFRNPVPDLKRFGGFVKNVFQLWKFAPKLFSNKPYFYKVL
jgi:GT2 family glycosyltransferase